VTTDVAVGQMRQIEFVADEEGDWALHCHKSHHTMNAMGHQVENLIGVEQGELAQKIGKLIPGYMVMGERGMADMGAMAMPLPENTAPMMGGAGPYGSLEMGGMFSVLKVRRDQQPGDYRDPGWFAAQAPAGTVAKAVDGTPPEPPRAAPVSATAVEMRARKPGGHPH
jgi:hypothetical protein